MATDVETGLGSTFKLANAAATLTLIGEPFSIPIPDGEAELIDASHYGSTDFRDYIQSPLREGEEADLEMNWVPGSATDDLCIEAVGKTRAFEISIPSDEGEGSYKFAGSVLVRRYTRVNPFDDKRTGTLRVKWVSAITETHTPPTP